MRTNNNIQPTKTTLYTPTPTATRTHTQTYFKYVHAMRIKSFFGHKYACSLTHSTYITAISIAQRQHTAQ